MSDLSSSEKGLLSVIVAMLLPFMLALAWVVLLPLTIYYAWCDMHLWNWFVVPYFHVPVMALWTALMLSLLARLQSSWLVYKDHSTKFWMTIFASFSGHTFALTIGLAVHHFVSVHA